MNESSVTEAQVKCIFWMIDNYNWEYSGFYKTLWVGGGVGLGDHQVVNIFSAIPLNVCRHSFYTSSMQSFL